MSRSGTRAAHGAGALRKKTVVRNGVSYTYWEARITTGRDPGTGKQLQRSFTGKTQREVREKLQAAAVSLSNKTYREPCKLTVGEWLDIWQEEYLGDVKPFTAASYRGQIRSHIKPALGAVKLEALAPHAIQSFYNALGKPKGDKPGLSPKSIKNVHGVLHRALRQAVENRYIPCNPADVCKLPRVERKPLRPLDGPQLAAFLAALQGHKFETLYTVALFTGLREGEALGLCWDCVDFQKGTLLIDKQLQREKQTGGAYVFAPLKNSKSRVIAPAPLVMRLLKSHRARQAEQRLRAGPLWTDSGLVFTNELGAHLAAPTVYKHFKAVAASIGCPSLRFHDLRHSYAVASLRAGDDIKTVQGNLGHATAAFTLDVYGHVTEQMRQASAARMEKYLQDVLKV